MRLIRRKPPPEPDPELIKRMMFLGFLMAVWVRCTFLRFEMAANRKAENE